MCQNENTTIDETLEALIVDLLNFKKNLIDNYTCLARDAEFVKSVSVYSEVFALERHIIAALRDVRRHMYYNTTAQYDNSDYNMRSIAEETKEFSEKQAQLLRDQAVSV